MSTDIIVALAMSHPDIPALISTIAVAVTLAGCSGEAVPTPKPYFLPPPTPQVDSSGGLVWRFDGQIGPTDNATVSCSAKNEKGMSSFEGCTLETTPSITADRDDLCSQGLYGQGTIVFMRRSPPGFVAFISRYDMAAALDPYLQCNSTQADQRQQKSIYEEPTRGRLSRRARLMEQTVATSDQARSTVRRQQVVEGV